MSGFFRRMAYYVLLFGIVFLVFLPLIGPWLVSFKIWVASGHWIGWQMEEALRAFRGGLILTPSAAFLLTLGEYGAYRGWWK